MGNSTFVCRRKVEGRYFQYITGQSPIQSAASDFALFSSILIRETIQKRGLPRDLKQVGTVHDSLIFYVNPESIHDIISTLYNICRNPETKKWFNFEVEGIEMSVDFEVGTTWANLKNYDNDKDYQKLLITV